ncbi:glycerophosphodiester phosphodiesterase [Colwellia sp. MSW7]|uniref:Glycerophosphodiester phosphodiesterase n=1 Tax=Colwellia maritima TaxID=2912588 RepID=A0ABS9X652_9GAMM|nr:glycerophosphodiester phosphodiesterase family protein [Colwellia maritima]MCI2285718.1 glycerophosphodiester phosphodiesterase [Colwellia maritima]
MLIFAHRGASGVEPENTLRAIQSAINTEVDGIEIDIYEADNTLFVIHDRRLHHTTSGIGQISQHNVDYLRSLDAGLGETIPTLDEVLALVAGKCMLNIELKGINNLDLLFSYLDQAINTSVLTVNDILLSSFNHRLLYNIKQQRGEFAIGALTSCYPLDYARFAEQLNAYSVHLDVNFISMNFVEDAHHRGLKVFVYTVDELEDIKTMKALGVDGIFTNFPTTAKCHIAHLSPTHLPSKNNKN